MFNILKKSFINLRRVFSNVKYLVMAFVFGFLFYLLNFLISVFGNISSFYKAQGLGELVPFIFNLFLGFKGTILLSSFISMIILSLLTGILFSLILYKVNLRKNISPIEIPSNLVTLQSGISNRHSRTMGNIINGNVYNTSILGGIGMFLGIFAPGCAACGLGLAAFFGLAASFATLPLKGLEISILAMIILIISIFRFSYTLNDDTCSIDYNHKNERRLHK